MPETDVPPAAPVPAAPAPQAPRRLETALVLALSVAAALAVRAWALSLRGVVDWDETYYYILGRNLVTGHGYTLNGLPHTAFPPLYPLLVGLASLVTFGISAATSSVSAVAGALLPVPVYFLARDVHGRRAGVFAAAAVALWPALFYFAPYSAGVVPYSHAMYFGSEPLYVTLIASGFLFIWLFSRYEGWRNALLAGVFFGLASLVRSEGPVVFAFLFAWLAVILTGRRRLWKGKVLLQLAAAGAAMAIVFSPFLVHVRSVSGRWTLGAKLGNNARIRDTLWNWVELGQVGDFLARHYQLNPTAEWMEDSYWGVSPWHRQEAAAQESVSGGFELVAHPDWRWLPPFFRMFYAGPLPLVPWYAWVFIVAGLLFPPWRPARFAWWSFVSANVLPMMLLAVSLYALPRHELPLLPLLAVSLARGLDGAASLIGRALSKVSRILAMAVSPLPAAIVLIMFAWQGHQLNSASALLGDSAEFQAVRDQQRNLVVSLREATTPGATLMANEPWLAVEAGLDWRVVPIASPAQLVQYATARHVDYALLQGAQIGRATDIRPLEPYYVCPVDVGNMRYFFFDFTSPNDQPPGGGG